ncbi:hypothetical protein AVEN_273378-1 [Araneus ventricosus]|uniref:Uncharacterized protein n=1 Tax=Araneus ventricosus TaxID=182803 RepID=A0A4Y2RHS3_ARAVE|nr:hypothetical protein AVEN_273378-1 [Araneus ventricosus]
MRLEFGDAKSLGPSGHFLTESSSAQRAFVFVIGPVLSGQVERNCSPVIASSDSTRHVHHFADLLSLFRCVDVYLLTDKMPFSLFIC